VASVVKEIVIGARPDDVWDALRDWGALHRRLVPGFATGTRVDGRSRIVTFFNGTVLRELIVALDDDARRLVWSIVDGPYTHHNASAQVLPAGESGSRFVWIADLLPDEAAERTGGFMDRGISTIKHTLEAAGG
jgi:polyketide cyclase/dehydrase/lipid transport protein